MIDILKLFGAAIVLLFIPGYFLSFIFIPKNLLDGLERLTLSFALSISVVPLIAFYLTQIGIPMTPLSILLVVVGIVLIAFGILYLINIKLKKND